MSSRTTAARDTRTRLLQAARDLLLSGEPFSMERIARLAGVSRQAVYLHFPDRFHLLDAIATQAVRDQGQDEKVQVLEATEDPHEQLRLLVEIRVAVVARHGELERAVNRQLGESDEDRRRWNQRVGRAAVIHRLVAGLVETQTLRADLTAAQAEALLQVLLSTEALGPLLGADSPAGVARLVLRAARAALLRSP